MIEETNVMSVLKEHPDKALKWMYDNYYSYICGVVYKMILDATVAEDIAQDVFFEIWKKRDRIQLQIGLKPYIRRAAVNKTLNYIRSKKMKFEEEENALEVDNGDFSTIDELAADELQLNINRSIEKLPERCRLIFGLSRYEHLSYGEIAEKLNISVKTVENQISKALKLLRTSLLQPA